MENHGGVASDLDRIVFRRLYPNISPYWEASLYLATICLGLVLCPIQEIGIWALRIVGAQGPKKLQPPGIEPGSLGVLAKRSDH